MTVTNLNVHQLRPGEREELLARIELLEFRQQGRRVYMASVQELIDKMQREIDNLQAQLEAMDE